MAAGRYSFTILQGSTLDFRIDYRDVNDAPIDLTDYEARMQIRPSATSNIVICNLTSQPGEDGTGLNMTPIVSGLQYPKASGSINIVISAASSSTFTFDEAHYDLEIYSGSGVTQVVNRILEGRVKLSKEVTRD